jgi:hypothetical protein
MMKELHYWSSYYTVVRAASAATGDQHMENIGQLVSTLAALQRKRQLKDV